MQKVFDFLPTPADVLRAATTCRQWRELACVGSVWRARFEREGLLEKAHVFEVALPPLPAAEGGEGSGSSSATSAASSERDELAGVGLASVLRAGVRAEGKGYYAA